MLQRMQILIDSETKRELETLSKLSERSISSLTRQMLKIGVKEIKKSHKRNDNGAKFLLELAKHAVKGPGNSEYDKYAYDF